MSLTYILLPVIIIIIIIIIITGKPTRKRPLGRPRNMGGHIIMDLEEIGINAGNWVDSAQDRDYCRALVNAA